MSKKCATEGSQSMIRRVGSATVSSPAVFVRPIATVAAIFVERMENAPAAGAMAPFVRIVGDLNSPTPALRVANAFLLMVLGFALVNFVRGCKRAHLLTFLL